MVSKRLQLCYCNDTRHESLPSEEDWDDGYMERELTPEELEQIRHMDPVEFLKATASQCEESDT